MDRRVWQATVHGVTKSRTRPSDLVAAAAAEQSESFERAGPG